MKRALTLAIALGLGFGCTGNEASRTGVGEPLLVKVPLPPPSKSSVLAQFIRGPLPGTLPTPDAGPGVSLGAALGADGGVQTLHATIDKYTEPFVRQGQANVAIGGTMSKDSFAIAVALEKLGTGYWVVPAGDLDGSSLLPRWDISADFGRDVPQGFRNLNYVSIDGAGNAGTVQSQKICIAGDIANYYPGCLANPNPPAAAISLSWDTNVDLDLQILAPDGRLIEPKNPLTTDLDAGQTLPKDAGAIDRDSNGGCAIDGIRYENLIWKTVAPHGRYGIYVNLFDACKQPVVHFNVSVSTAVTADDGTPGLRTWYSADGILMDFQANGGSNRGLFVSEFVFQ